MKTKNTKEALLVLFEKNKGRFFSGEEIAETLSVSRAAVWKAVVSLREDGYAIEAQKGKGYCLSPDTDIVSAQGMAKYLKQDLDLDLVVFDEVTSTNTLLKERAAAGAEGPEPRRVKAGFVPPREKEKHDDRKNQKQRDRGSGMDPPRVPFAFRAHHL